MTPAGPVLMQALSRLVSMVHNFLADPRVAWSMGAPGALAEFMRLEDETAEVRPSPDGGQVATARGAIALNLVQGVRALAYETVSAHPGRWGHAVALCLPAEAARRGARSVLTDLGQDLEALRLEDRRARLFDLGLDLGHVNFCVRSDASALATTLERAAGEPILTEGGPLPALLAARPSPHRVVETALGRIEVRGPIPPPAHEGGETPPGPHTHLLPHLVGTETGSPNGLPESHVVCASIYPPGTPTDALGRPSPVDRRDHQSFQAVLAAFGDPDVLAEKARIGRALIARQPPADYRSPRAPRLQDALRIALRQRRALDGDTPILSAYQAHFDPARPD